jgi:hypothetical protein
MGRDGFEWAPTKLTRDQLGEATRLYWKATRWGLTRCSSDGQRAQAEAARTRAPQPVHAGTLVLTESNEHGADRGKVGELLVAFTLGVDLEPDITAPFDLRAGDGTRLDVKTTRSGGDLMVPLEQKHKVNPERVDGFVLVHEDPLRIAGCISTARFLEEHAVTNGERFPVPTMHVPATRLARLPARFHHTSGTRPGRGSRQAEDPTTSGTTVQSGRLT